MPSKWRYPTNAAAKSGAIAQGRAGGTQAPILSYPARCRPFVHFSKGVKSRASLARASGERLALEKGLLLGEPGGARNREKGSLGQKQERREGGREGGREVLGKRKGSERSGELEWRRPPPGEGERAPCFRKPQMY